METYSYTENTHTFTEDVGGYGTIVSEILRNLSEYSDSQRHINREFIEQDEQIKVPEECFEGDYIIEPLQKFNTDNVAVYVFDRPKGIDLIGNKAMIDINLPENMPSLY